MAISKLTQAALERGDFDAIEDQWLSHSAESPDDLDYFVGVARSLVGNGRAERAQFLLEVLDDLLKQQESWAGRLKMLQRAGTILFEAAEEQHAAIIETLEGLHSAHSNFEALVDKMGLHKAPQDLPKTWQKVERLNSLLAFDIGAVVHMKGKGAGRIIDINLPLESLKIKFEQFPSLMVGFRAAPKLLAPLAPNHFLVRKLEKPEELKAIAKADPPRLLGLLLQSFGEPLTGAEIKTTMNMLVETKKWASWWSSARKHPQVVTRGKGRQTYQWAETTEDAFEALWIAFSAAEDRTKLDLYRRDGKRHESLGRRMADHLKSLGDRFAASKPSLAVEIWYELDRGGATPGDVSWSPTQILTHHNRPVDVLNGLQDRGRRELAYGLIREIEEDWPKIYEKLIRHEGESALLTLLAEALSEADPTAFLRYTEQLVSQPRKQPAAFVWLAERAANDPVLLERSPLRFLTQMLSSLQDETFAPYRASRLVPLVETGGTVPRLLTYIDEEQAEQALSVISRASGLEDYQRQALTASIELKFASLRQDDDLPLYALLEYINTKKAELRELRLVDIPTNRKAIEEARAMGDLRENFEYKSARQRHEYLNSRLASLSHELSRAQPIDVSPEDCSTVRVGTRVEFTGDGDQRYLTILGPWESSPEEDIISYESELAKSFLGKATGASADIGGTAYKITKIEAYS